MKKRKTSFIIITAVIIFAIILLMIPKTTPEEKIAKCIGENSKLYTQLGCHACLTQENMFGKNYKHLTVIDCVYEREACSQASITATPTWIINEEKITGVQSISKLQELTGC